jgi:cellulose synthase operon protein C
VPRALDGELAAPLCAQPLVLVKGQSRAGKSRTGFEVAARQLPGFRLLVPNDRVALSALAELDPLPGQGDGVLVWLDDLDEYLAVEGARGLDAGLLDRWAAREPPVRVLATIRTEEYGRLSAAPGMVGRTVRVLLNRFDPGAITLPVTFDDPAERTAIAELYPGERLSGGLAEHRLLRARSPQTQQCPDARRITERSLDVRCRTWSSAVPTPMCVRALRGRG